MPSRDKSHSHFAVKRPTKHKRMATNTTGDYHEYRKKDNGVPLDALTKESLFHESQGRICNAVTFFDLFWGKKDAAALF